MRRLILILVTALFMTGAASAASAAGAAAPVKDLSPWQGNYISRNALMDRPEMQSLYREIVKAAAAKGKSYTIEGVKKFFARNFHTDFRKMRVEGNTITFYPFEKAAKPITLTYKYAGEIPDSYGKFKFSWHGFSSDAGGAKDAPYVSLLLMKIHKHNKGVPHFHMRYSSKGLKEIVGPEFKRWWPIILPEDVDIKAFIKGRDIKKLAGILP